MMVSARWRNSVVAACSIALVLALSACGSEQYDPNADGTTTTTPTSEPSAKQTTNGVPLNTPVTLRRTGGFAGFNDTLTVEADGTAKLVTRGRKPFTCTVEPALFDKLNKTMQSVDIASAPSGYKSTRPPIADEIYLSLEVGDKVIRYQNLESGPSTLRELFNVLSQVLNSAWALQKGTADSGNACTA